MEERDIILKAENISKQYRLGTIGTGTISHDLNRWWHTIRGKEDPYLKVGEINDRTAKGQSEYVWALQDISFEVERGEVLGIIGKNGAGKSTLLKILSKVTSPTTGTIKSRGRIASLLEVGTGFNPELTGRENIYLNGAILGMTKKEITDKLDEIIAFSGCERYIDTPTKRYSSGMTVRLAFAVAAFLEPEILVVDEVLAVGDAEFQKKAIGKMQDISRSEGRTVLFVSHNMGSVQNLCTKGLLLENGSVSMHGAIKDVIEVYLQKQEQIGNKSFDGYKYIKDVKVLNNNNILSSELSMGCDFTLKIDAKNIKNSNGLHLGFFIKDIYGNRVTSFSTAMKEGVVKYVKDVEFDTYLFRIKRPNLLEGKYLIDITVAYKTGGRAEFIENAYGFQIISSDVYGSGVILNDYFGKIYLDVETTIEEAV